jgi:hypothetical protein
MKTDKNVKLFNKKPFLGKKCFLFLGLSSAKIKSNNPNQSSLKILFTLLKFVMYLLLW